MHFINKKTHDTPSHARSTVPALIQKFNEKIKSYFALCAYKDLLASSPISTEKKKVEEAFLRFLESFQLKLYSSVSPQRTPYLPLQTWEGTAASFLGLQGESKGREKKSPIRSFPWESGVLGA